jgi:DnaJ-domain-containing protein 1
MKQIFDRIKNILKAELNNTDDTTPKFNFDFDDDLKREFENLNNNFSQNTSSKTNYGILKEAFKILEISENASNDEIKQAYISKIKEYHPDKVASLGKDLQKIAEIKTKEINEAYNLIRKVKGF